MHAPTGARPDDIGPLRGGELNAAITSALLGINTRHLGRGSRSATTFHRDNMVVTVLGGVLTKVEQTLVADGQIAAVAEMRRLAQQAMASEYVSAVERLTGVTVTAFVSGSNPAADMATEVFVLAHRLDRLEGDAGHNSD